MKKTLQLSCLTAAIAALGFTSQAFAAPTFFGNIVAGVQKIQGDDLDGQAFEASFGAKGMLKQDDLRVIYKLETEFTQATNARNGQGEVEVKNALVVLATKKYGSLVIAPRTEAGQQKDLYKPVDLFEVNEADSTHGLWRQADEVTSAIAYVSPIYANTKFVGAVLTIPDNATDDDTNANGQDADAWAVRMVHNSGDLYFGAGVVVTSKEFLTTATGTSVDKNYYRSMVSASYKMDQLTLGGGWEHNENDPAGVSDITQVNATYQFNENWSSSIAYIDKNHMVDTKDDHGVLAIAKKKLMPNVYAFVEAAHYEVKSNNMNVGVDVKF